MGTHSFFIDRRKKTERRLDRDPCQNMPLDLYHRKRRKSPERRTIERSIAEDYLAQLNESTSLMPTHH